MRTSTNTIIFEQALDAIPVNAGPVYDYSTQLLSPVAKVVVDSCHSAMGEQVKLELAVLGRTHTVSEDVVTYNYLFGPSFANTTMVSTRTLATCVAPGGICKTCLLASRPHLFTWTKTQPGGGLNPVFTQTGGPAVNSQVYLTPEFEIASELVSAVPGTADITLKYGPEAYDRIHVYVEGKYYPTSAYTVSGTTLTFTDNIDPAPLDTDGPEREEVYVTIRYVIKTRTPFFYWLTGTYAGALIGALKFPQEYLTIRKELHRSLLPMGVLEDLSQIVINSPLTPVPIARYLDEVRDPLEKAVLVSTVGGIFLV